MLWCHVVFEVLEVAEQITAGLDWCHETDRGAQDRVDRIPMNDAGEV